MWKEIKIGCFMLQAGNSYQATILDTAVRHEKSFGSSERFRWSVRGFGGIAGGSCETLDRAKQHCRLAIRRAARTALDAIKADTLGEDFEDNKQANTSAIQL